MSQPDAPMAISRAAAGRADARSVAAIPSPAPAAEETLGTVSLTGSGHHQFALRLVGCGNAGCALEVSVVPPAAPPLRTTFDWALPVGVNPGAIDPDRIEPLVLAPASKDTRGWQVGSEEHAAIISATPLRFGPAGVAMALEMEAGFEHVSRRHALLVPKAPTSATGSPILRWEKQDGAGPHATTLVALDRGVGAGDWPVYLDAFLDPSPDAPETLSAQILRLDDASDTIVETSLVASQIGLPAVAVGRFVSAGAARKARGKASCLAGLLVLSAQGFDGGSKHGFVLARVGTSRPLVEKQARRLSSCGPRQRVRVSSWRGTP